MRFIHTELLTEECNEYECKSTKALLSVLFEVTRDFNFATTLRIPDRRERLNVEKYTLISEKSFEVLKEKAAGTVSHPIEHDLTILDRSLEEQLEIGSGLIAGHGSKMGRLV